MRMILREIRKIELVNKIIRFILKATSKLEIISTELQKRWPVSGLVDCEFKGSKFKLYNRCDDGLVHYFFYNKEYHEESDLYLFRELSKSARCILDIGANTGLFSIIASLSNSQVKIYAFEPYPANIERLKLNLKANNLVNVQVMPEAIGETSGHFEIAVPEDNSITSVASMNQSFSQSVNPEIKWKSITVPINTIDNLKKKIELPVDLIKCDVETFEMSVFKGAHDTLKADKPTILFESFLDDERRLFFNDILRTYNYFLYLVFTEGVVYSETGFPEKNTGLNFLITAVKPKRTFISFDQPDLLRDELLLHPIR